MRSSQDLRRTCRACRTRTSGASITTKSCVARWQSGIPVRWSCCARKSGPRQNSWSRLFRQQGRDALSTSCLSVLPMNRGCLGWPTTQVTCSAPRVSTQATLKPACVTCALATSGGISAIWPARLKIPGAVCVLTRNQGFSERHKENGPAELGLDVYKKSAEKPPAIDWEANPRKNPKEVPLSIWVLRLLACARFPRSSIDSVKGDVRPLLLYTGTSLANDFPFQPCVVTPTVARCSAA